MEYRPLGATGLRVSALGMGGNVFGPPRMDLEASRRTLDAALDAGVNFIDTAHFYNEGRSEAFLGELLAGRRERVLIATKFHLLNLDGESAAARVRRHCDESLTRLRTDRVDLLQIHFLTPGFPLPDVLEALAGLVQSGKVRFVGQCNFSAWRHVQADTLADAHGWPKLATAQNQYNLLRRLPEAELLPMCAQRNVGFLPYFPLAGGFLTGKYRPGQDAPAGTRGASGSGVVRRMREPRFEALLTALQDFARQRGHTVGELAIAWLLSRPQVSSVIAGAMTPEQVQANAAGAAWTLGADDVAALDALTRPDALEQAIEPDLASFR